MRVYQVVLAPDKETFEANEQLDSLKQVYDEYLQQTELVAEQYLIKLLKTGRVRKVTYAGSLSDES